MTIKKKQSYSLRSTLTLWFLIFSIMPLLLITLYSLVEFQMVFNGEQRRRLEANFKEIANSLNVLEGQLATHIREHARDPKLISALSTASMNQIESLFEDWINTYSISQISLFDKEGFSQLILFKDSNQQDIQRKESGSLRLPESLMAELLSISYRSFRDIHEDQMELTVYSKILVNNQIQGFIQEMRRIGQNDLYHFKNLLNVDLVILNNHYNPIISTRQELLSQDISFLKTTSRFSKFVDQIRPYNFYIQSIDSKMERIHLGLTAVRNDEQDSMINKISKALLTGLIVIIIFLIVIWILVSRMIVRPISNLASAAKQIESGKLGTQLSIRGPREINELIKTFNNMSLRIAESIHKLEETNKELHETQAQLVHSAKMMSLGQLVAGVAHELNNPIGFIYSNMAHLKTYLEDLIKLINLMQKDPQQAVKFKKDMDYDYLVKDLPKLIKSCQDGSKRLMEIVSGLRTFSRLDSGGFQDYYLEENIKSTLDILSGEIKTRIQVHLDLKDVSKIHCHAGQINQVLMNIISNATQAIKNEGNIWITAKKHVDYIEIEIRDDGQGIQSDQLSYIFDPFFTTKDVGQGTGLGLSISYNIVQKHGGDIKVSSKENKGTTFIIKLPLKPPKT